MYIACIQIKYKGIEILLPVTPNVIITRLSVRVPTPRHTQTSLITIQFGHIKKRETQKTRKPKSRTKNPYRCLRQGQSL